MKSAKFIKLWLIALCFVVATAGLASADLLVSYQGNTPLGTTGGNEFLAKVVVGGDNVDIGSFGVYGQARVDGNVKWLIFDVTQLTSPVYLSAAQAVSGNPGAFADEAQWYDSPEITGGFTLLAGHTYAMGLIADRVGTNTFYWGDAGYNPFGGWPATTGGGLTVDDQYLDNSGVVGGVFTNTPTLYNIGADTRFKASLRVFSPEPPAVPVPPSALLLGSGILGLGILRFRKA
jgi:hypothetical protein